MEHTMPSSWRTTHTSILRTPFCVRPALATFRYSAPANTPCAFIPGITGKLSQQFAVTIAISVLLSAFNALTLSPALAALLLKPRTPSKGLLQRFFDWFNRVFERATEGYVRWSAVLLRKTVVVVAALAVF